MSFYMVRVASPKDQAHANYTKKDLSGMDAKEQLAEISKRTHELNAAAVPVRTIARRFRLWSMLASIINEHEKLTKR